MQPRPPLVPMHILWPGIIISFLLFSILSQVYLVMSSRSDGGARIEEDYYRRGLAWDERKALKGALLELGWSVEVVGVEQGEGVLTVRILDRDGAPVLGVQGELEAKRADEVKASSVSALRPDPARPGFYVADAPAWRPGLWDVSLRGQRGDRKFLYEVRQQRAEAASAVRAQRGRVL